MVIVATAMDNSTERIITYLRNTYMVDINILFFHVFSYNDKRFISRAWFAEDAEEAPAPVAPVGNLWHIAITKANRLWQQYRHTIHQNQQQPGLSIRAVAHVVGVAVYPRGQNGGFAFTSLSRAVSAASVYPPAAMRTLRRLLSELRARRFAGIHRAARPSGRQQSGRTKRSAGKPLHSGGPLLHIRLRYGSR